MLSTEQVHTIRMCSKDDESFLQLLKIIATLSASSDLSPVEEETGVERVHVFQDASTALMVEYDQNTRYTFANPLMTYDVAGSEADGVHNRTLFESSDSSRDSSVQQVFETGHFVSALHEVSTLAGNKIYDTIYAPIRDRKGNIERVIGIARDITQSWQRLRHLEQTLEHRAQELEERRIELYRQRTFSAAVLDTVDALIIVLDREGHIVQFNRTCERVSGYRLEEVAGRYCWNFLIPEDEIAGVKRAFAQLQVGFPNTHENFWCTKDGRLRRIAWSSTMLRNDDGLVEYIIGTGIDMTERKQAEDALRYNQSLFQAFLDNTPAVIFAKDLDGRLILVNRQFVQFFQREQTHLLDAIDYDLFPQSVANDMRSVDERVLETGISIETEDRIPHGDDIHTYMTTKFPIADEHGRVYALGGVAIDITERKRFEDALRRSKERYRGLIQSQFDLITRTDPEGRLTFVNDAYCQTFGKACEEFMGQSFLAMIAAEDIPTVLEALQQLEIPPHRTCFEQRSSTAQGMRWFAWEGYAIQDEQGRTVEYQAVGQDITERKRMEEALRTSEARYRAIVEDQTEFICRYLPDGIITFVNEAYCRYLGLSRDEVLGSLFSLHIHAEDRERVEQTLQTLSAAHPVVTLEHRVVMPDGQISWQQWTHRLLVDEQGAFVEFQAVGRDIRARVHAEEQVMRINAAVESTSDAVSIADSTGNALYLNQAFRTIYGYTVEHLQRLGTINTLIAEPTIAQEVVHTLQEGHSWSGEVNMRARDGQLIPTLLRADSFQDKAGAQLGFVAVCTDITLQKEVEQELIAAREAALQASRLKSEFLANMSHEIRTPLNAIIGMASLLFTTNLDEEQRDYAETIRTSSDTLVTLINDILDFSKIEAGRIELEYQPFRLAECIEESLDLVASQAAQKQLELAYGMDATTPPLLIGDVTRLRQVLVNLLSNAVKFTDQGQVVVSVRSHQKDEQHYEVHITVQDSGIGIAPTHMHRLFETFSQVDSSVTRKYGGTGLGLVISKALVELMGGRIWVESEFGNGSTFHFTFVTSAAPQQHEQLPDEHSSLLVGKRVLIVNDHPTNCQILVRQVEAWGMRAQVTTSADESLRWIQLGVPFDVAILDMQLSERDGLTLASEIQTFRSPQTLPLLLLTSVGGLRERQGVEIAASLTKPMKPSALYALLLDLFADSLEQQSKVPVQPPRHTPHQQGRSVHILLAEDHAVNQKVALRLLERLGYRADVAANGLEVLDALKRQSYDVILMDDQMPEMDGIEAASRIRTQWPAAQQPYIIALTAHALEGARERYLAAGMDDYLSKPVRLEELAAVLEQFQELVERNPPMRQAPVPASPDISPAVDRTVLQDLIASIGEDGMETMREVIDVFLEHTPQVVNQLAPTFAEQNFTLLYRLTHSILPSCAQLGAMRLAALCKDLEHQGREQLVAGTAELIAKIDAEYQRVEQELIAFKST